MQPEHKKYILDNINRKPIPEIARDLNIKERKIRKFLEKHKHSQQAKATLAIKPRLKNTLIFIIIIIALGFVIYGQSIDGEFIWDDEHLVRDNLYIRDSSHISDIFTKDIAAGSGKDSFSYRPLQILSYALNYSLFKLDVRGYHLTNILAHILVALVIFWLASLIFEDRLLALFSSVLFLVHPIHTAAVAYISGRADSMSALFMLLCFILYVRKDSIGFYILMLSSYAMALLSKENSLILPGLLLLYHYAFNKKLRVKQFVSILSMAGIYVILRLTLLKSLLPHTEISSTFIQRIPGFFVAITNYIRLLFLPFGLHMEYGAKTFGLAEPKAIMGIIIFVGLLAYAFKKRQTNKLAFFCISWFFLALLPVSNLYPVNAYMAEHWLYIPSIGFFLLLARGISYLYRRQEARAFIISVFLALVSFYSILTFKQNAYWSNPLVFYQTTLKYVPHNPRIYNNLGVIYFTQNNNPSAIALYEKAIEVSPEYTDAYINLGNVYESMGRQEQAIPLYEKAIQIDPGLAEAYNNLGNALVQQDRQKAIASYRKAIELKPEFAEAYNNLGNAYSSINIEESIALYSKAIEINPDYAQAHYNLGIAYNQINDNVAAIASFKKAIQLNPNYAKAYNNLAIIYFHSGKYDLAIEYAVKASQLGFVSGELLDALKEYR